MFTQVGALSVWGIVLFPVDGRDSFCVVSRRITPDWPQANMFIRTLQQAINGTKYQEPTQELVSLPLWPSPDVDVASVSPVRLQMWD